MKKKNIGRTIITIVVIVLLIYAIINSINESIWDRQKQESELESRIEKQKEKTEETKEEISIKNSPPVVRAGEDRTIEAGSTITLSAYRTTDPDGDDLTYMWDLGDERIAEGIIVQVQYSNPGEYLITLTASDRRVESKDSFTLIVLESISKPAITFEIIEGPFLETGFCVYRVRAYVEGDPSPEFYFNRDDGLPINDKIAQINLTKEEKQFTLIATAENKFGKVVEEITLENTCH